MDKVTTQQLGELFGSRGRVLVLAALAEQPGEEVTASEVARRQGLTVPDAARQLARLERLGLLESHRRGRLRLYRVREGFPLWPELRRMMVKSVGAAGVLRSALARLDLQLAAIFGSVARGEDTLASDVDLLVVGAVSMADLSAVLDEVEVAVGREINPALYTPEGLREEVGHGNPWLESVLRGEMLYLRGDEHVLRAIAGTAED
jgi:uncharacterized protein